MPPAEARLIAGIPDGYTVETPALVSGAAIPSRKRVHGRREVQPTENEADEYWNVQRTAREVIEQPLSPKGRGYLLAMAMSEAIGSKDYKRRAELLSEIPVIPDDDDKVA
jgi:hypothetical protein